MNKKGHRSVAILCLALGSLLFVLIGVISVWGDIEAALFNSRQPALEPLTTLRCPSVLTTEETGYITTRIVNETDEAIIFKVRAFITDGDAGSRQEINLDVPLGAQESQLLEWPVTAENAAPDRVILAEVHQLKNTLHPHRSASCGIIVIDIPFLTGSQLLAVTMGMGVLLAGSGLLLWPRPSATSKWQNPAFRWAIIFTVASLLLGVAGLLSRWGLALLLAGFWALSLIGMIWRIISTAKR